MPLPLLALAVGTGVGRALLGGITANQERQRKKGIIGRSYELGRKRLNLAQGDTRQSVAEAMTARGLAQGGTVRVGGPAKLVGEAGTGKWGTPGSGEVDVSQAHDLSSQAGVDLNREQQLQQESLWQQKEAAKSDVNAEATQAMVNAGASGISSAMGVYGIGQDLRGMSGAGAPAGIGGGAPIDTSVAGGFGLHPLTTTPILMGRSPGVSSLENSSFNKYSTPPGGL